MDAGFTDLRLNRQDGQINESFWPSFTDVMTTVVMIFLIAMVVLLARNIELVNQLRSTMEAERIAAELARATGQEKDSLSIALHQAEEEMQLMRLEIMRLQDKGVEREAIIAQQLAAIQDMGQSRDELTERAAQLMLLRQRLEADVKNQQAQLRTAIAALDSRQLELDAARTDVSHLKSNIQSLESSLDTAQRQSSALQAQLTDRRKELDAQRQKTVDIERKYASLTGDYGSLKVKYDKLIRPARSSSGRYPIEVRYWKNNGNYNITWREQSMDEHQTITREGLDAALKSLDEEKKNGLYIRVILPKNSGLSYNEAEEFTRHIHSNYDYYFKK
jgi:chromosome segregation ATPase